MGGPIIRVADLGTRLDDFETRLRNLEVGTPVDVGQTILVDYGFTSGQNVTSTSPIDLTGGSQTFTLKRAQTVIVFVTANFGVTAGADYGYVWGDLDGQGTVKMNSGNGPKGYMTQMVGFSKRLDKGSHIVKMRSNVGPGTTVNIVEGALFVWGVLGT